MEKVRGFRIVRISEGFEKAIGPSCARRKRIAHVDPDAGEQPTENGRSRLVGDPGLAASGRAGAGLRSGALAFVPSGRVERGGLVRARPAVPAGAERAVEEGGL